MRTSPTLRAALAAAFVLPLAVLAGCDAADPADAGTEAVSNQEAAVAVANGLAFEAGGALDAVGAAAATGGLNSHDPEPGCQTTRTYDEATQTWTRTIDCERSTPGGRFFARFGRTQTFRFYDAAGTPQQDPETAASVDAAIVDGYGERRNPVLHHLLLDIGAAFTVTDLQEELVTVNGTYDRSATDTLRVRRRGPNGGGAQVVQRTLIYDLALAFDDVRGPRRAPGEWGRPVSGTITGTIAGTSTFTNPRGQTVTRDFERAFTIVFGGEPEADIATLRVGGESFRANLRTGAVEGVD